MAERVSGKRDFEAAVGVGLASLPSVRNAEGFNRRPASHCKYSLHALLRPIGDDFPGTRHGSHEVMELPLDRGKIVEDVGMIELDVVQNRGAGTVVDELRAL